MSRAKFPSGIIYIKHCKYKPLSESFEQNIPLGIESTNIFSILILLIVFYYYYFIFVYPDSEQKFM